MKFLKQVYFKKNLITIMIVVISVMFAGCGTSKTSVFTLKSRGRNKVISAIERKYGETPRIVSQKVEWGTGYVSPGCLPSPSNIGPDGGVSYTLSIGWEEFSAYTEADDDNSPVYDDYEADFIEDELVRDIEERLDISCFSSFIKYKDTSSYGRGLSESNMLSQKFSDPWQFYNSCHTLFYVGTYDYIDEEKVADLFYDYDLEKDLSYLSLIIVQFEEDGYPEYGESECIYPKYVAEDDQVIDFYEVVRLGSYSDDKVNHNDELMIGK